MSTIDYFAAIQAKAQEGMNGEVKMLARMATDAQRTVYLEAVADARGRESARDLRRLVWAYMQQEKLKSDEPQQEALFA